MRVLLTLAILCISTIISFKLKQGDLQPGSEPGEVINNPSSSRPSGLEASTDFSSPERTAEVEKIIYSRHFWCWYPCYCWVTKFVDYYRSVPLCWCYYPCGCFWQDYFFGAARDIGITPASARGYGASALLGSEERVKPPQPSENPPSEEPNV
jgi:hypothetical protein